MTIIARTGERDDGRPELTAIIVSQDTPGYTCGPAYEKLGWRASDQHPLFLEDCRVPEENVLGERIIRKLDVSDRTQAVVRAIETGLITPETRSR